MPSVEITYIRQRRREIRHTIDRSSPALIYSGPFGIALIAANKSAVRNRIGKILDRMAIVSRGELTASDLVHKAAAAEAYVIAHSLSRGDVLGHEPVQAVSTLLSRHYHAFMGEPLAAESCLVQLTDAPDTDYLAHVQPDGSVKLFDRILYLGAHGERRAPDGQDRHAESSHHEAKDGGAEHGSQDTLDELNRELRERYVGYTSIASLIADLEHMPELEQLFTAGKRRDIVVLDRDALLHRDFNGIFKRLTL